MIRGKTTEGFEFEVDEEALKDSYDFVDLYTEYEHRKNTDEDLSEEEELWYILSMVKMMLGKKSFNRLRKFCRVKGIVSAERMNKNLAEIFEYSGEDGSIKK